VIFGESSFFLYIHIKKIFRDVMRLAVIKELMISAANKSAKATLLLEKKILF